MQFLVIFSDVKASKQVIDLFVPSASSITLNKELFLNCPMLGNTHEPRQPKPQVGNGTKVNF